MGEKDITEKLLMDYKMPFRIIAYDGAAYRSQLLSKRKKIVPVVSFVLYFGTEKRWSKRQSIKKFMKVPKALDIYVNDYKINVIEVAWLSDEQLKQFKSDFGIVANFFVQKRKNKDYVPDDTREIKHVDAVLKLLSVMTNDNSYSELLYEDSEGKAEVKTMCEVANRLKSQGRREGRCEGIREGRREVYLELVESKLAKGKTTEQIMEELELSREELGEIIRSIQGKEEVI